MSDNRLNEPLVSVVMLSFNNINIIGGCLQALSKSTYKNIETIILDCSSKDGSPDFIQTNFPWVKLVKFNRDPGPDAAYTYGVKQAKGQYVLLLSADVRVLPETLSNLVNDMNNEALDVAVPVCIDWDGRYTNGGLGWPYFNVEGYDLFSFFLKKTFSSVKTERPFYIIFPCCLVRKDAYLEVPFNGHIGIYEDVEWTWRLALAGKKIKVLEDTYCLHKVGASIKGCRAFASNAKSALATFLVCAKTTELVFLSLPLITFQCLNLFVELANLRVGNAQGVIKGWSDYLKSFGDFLNDRKNVHRKKDFNFLIRVVEAENYKRNRRYLLRKQLLKPITN